MRRIDTIITSYNVIGINPHPAFRKQIESGEEQFKFSTTREKPCLLKLSKLSLGRRKT
jgi:hypothetical protein